MTDPGNKKKDSGNWVGVGAVLGVGIGAAIGAIVGDLLYYVLKWLGPLGGFLARHGYVQDYRQYYRPK